MEAKELVKIQALELKAKNGKITDKERAELDILLAKQAAELAETEEDKDETKEEYEEHTSISRIITNLPERQMRIAIYKMNIRNDGNGEYWQLSCYDMKTGKSHNLSVSQLMAESFKFVDILQEGSFISENAKKVYQLVSVIDIPDDGKRYGYKVKKTGAIVEYRTKGTTLIKDFQGAIDAATVKQYEMMDLLGAELTSRAAASFQMIKGRPYVAGVSDTDDIFLMSLLTAVK